MKKMSKQSQKPTVKYHTKVSFDQNANKVIEDSNHRNKLEVNHVIKVINGTLESVVHLIGYSYFQIKEINRQLSMKYDMKQNQEFDLSLFDDQISNEIKNSRPSRAHIVEYEDRLYGVIFDEGIARICGQINRIIPCLKDDKYGRGIRIHRSSGTDNWRILDKEVHQRIQNGEHIINISEKGSLFIVPNSDCSGHQFDNKLLLVLGHGFVIIEETPQIPVLWIRTKQTLREYERESTELLREESIFVAFAAIAIGTNHYKIIGTGSVANIQNIQQFSDPF